MAYQDFIAQQQHPYKQLGFMSDLLRGSGDLAGKGGTTVYQAPPSPLSQLAGLGTAAYGATKMFNLGEGKAAGGLATLGLHNMTKGKG
jgi:hypothetical protein